MVRYFICIYFLFVFSSAKVVAANDLVFSVDLLAGEKVIENKFSDINVWHFWPTFGPDISGRQPDFYFSKKYPFVKRVQLMTATGGSQDRDLFVAPKDRSRIDDYKFDSLITACRNIIRFGLKPEIKTGNVPLKLSSTPYISSAFGVNVRPPNDYEQYFNYIKAVALALVSEFGLEEVKLWSWGVFTEYENRDWFLAEDSNPESTKRAYFKIYDYTVAALEEVIGPQNLIVGAHSMTSSPGLWDSLEFIDHVASGINFKTGKVGTHVDFLTASFYDTQPGVLNSNSFDYYIDLIRSRAEKNGLYNLKYGIDEGRILKGADGKMLTNYEVAMSYQAAADAKNFKTMIEKDINWFSRWGVTTEGLFGGVDTVGTNLANLGYKMVGDNYISVDKQGMSSDKFNEVDAFASINLSSKIAHLMLFNFNKNVDSVTGEKVGVIVNNIDLIGLRKVLVKKWVIDDINSNYWGHWFADMSEKGIGSPSFHRSMYSIKAGLQLRNQTDRDFWYANEMRYAKLSALKPSVFFVDVSNGVIALDAEVPHHGVVFYEITPEEGRLN